MFQPSIAVIRAVHSERIRRDVIARHRPEIAPRESILRMARRSIGRSIVRFGARVANEPSVEHTFRLAR